MRQLSPTRRALIAVLAIFQMGVPALVTVADADLALNSAGAQVHVEDHTGRNCRPVHPDSCALCQLLSHLTPQRAGAPVVPSTVVARSGPCDDASTLLSYIARSLERSRAPPVG
jgi:hypothetical protein